MVIRCFVCVGRERWPLEGGVVGWGYWLPEVKWPSWVGLYILYRNVWCQGLFSVSALAGNSHQFLIAFHKMIKVYKEIGIVLRGLLRGPVIMLSNTSEKQWKEYETERVLKFLEAAMVLCWTISMHAWLYGLECKENLEVQAGIKSSTLQWWKGCSYQPGA